MEISSQEFHHLIRVLFCIDGWTFDGVLDHDQQASLCRDPIRFFLACDDTTRELIWFVMLERHNRYFYDRARTTTPTERNNIINLMDALRRTTED